jgi:flagellar FliJ protein
MATPFRFGLERVRDLRAHAEEQAKEQFAASLSQRVRGEAMLRAVEDRLAGARRSTPAVNPGAPSLTGAELVSHQAWVERLERSRQDAAVKLAAADRQLQDRRIELTEASRRREVLDQLEARQREAHRREAERRDGIELDEMALRVFRDRSAA